MSMQIATLRKDGDGWYLAVDGPATALDPRPWSARIDLPFGPAVARATVESIIARSNPALVVADAGSLT